jgi:hypothetical protein
MEWHPEPARTLFERISQSPQDQWVDLCSAVVTSEQLAQAASLAGATLPDGTIHLQPLAALVAPDEWPISTATGSLPSKV